MSAMREGVSSFILDFTRSTCLDGAAIGELEAWRQILQRLALIGRDAGRYDGLGFGNISSRYRMDGVDGFIITGTQTGGRPVLSVADYALVTDWDLDNHRIVARGLCKPSSEALTHGQVYRQAEDVSCVVHGHCPEIWQQAGELRLPTTAPEATYGTPAMAREVERLLPCCRDHGRVLVMGGHQDGVLSFGSSCTAAVKPLIIVLARALEISGRMRR